jgi:hypothetical protein
LDLDEGAGLETSVGGAAHQVSFNNRGWIINTAGFFQQSEKVWLFFIAQDKTNPFNLS